MPTPISLALRAGITDMRPRFREIYSAVHDAHQGIFPCERPIEAALLKFADEAPVTEKAVHLGAARLKLHFVILPGLLADCLSYQVSPFQMRLHLHEHGYEATVLWVNGRSSCEYNAQTIYEALHTQDKAQRLVFVGYSKGAVDALQAITTYPEIRERTAAVVSVAGAVYGSPIAEIVPAPIRWFIRKLSVGHCNPGDGKSLESLDPALRSTWLEQNPLPSEIRYFTLAGAPQPEHVSRLLSIPYRIMQKRFGANDSQVLYQDTQIPNSQFLGFVNADHFAIALPLSERWYVQRFFLNHNDYPREVLLESVVRYVEEVLLEDKAA